MSDNIVYEISRLMNDQEIIKSDLNDAAALVTEMFRNKYINRLNDKILEHRKRLTKNPPREVQLMSALKQFMPESSREMADKAIDAFIAVNTFSNFREELSGARIASVEKTSDSSVHSDGVYDLDPNCLKKKERNDLAGIIFAMAMLSAKSNK